MTTAGSLRVAVTCGPLSVPPTYFIVQHAERLGAERSQVFALRASINDESLTVPIHEVLPRIPEGVPGAARMQFQLQVRFSHFFMARAIREWSPDVIHQHFATYGDGAVRASQSLGVPLVTTLHGSDAYQLHFPGSTRMRRWYQKSLARVRDQSHKLLAVSRFFADEAISLGWPADKIDVHYQGIDADYFRPNPDVFASEDHELPIVLAAGSLSRHKGVEQIAAVSAELHPKVPHKLVFVGEGPERAAVQRVAADNRHIQLVGAMDREGIRRWMQRADLFVMNSQPSPLGRRESAGLVALEAQASGLPVAVAHSGGTSEMFLDQETGLGFSENSKSGLRIALERLLSMSSEDRQHMGIAGREFVVNHRSLEVSLQHLEQIWASL